MLSRGAEKTNKLFFGSFSSNLNLEKKIKRKTIKKFFPERRQKINVTRKQVSPKETKYLGCQYSR